MKKDVKVYLNDIKESCERITSYIKDKDKKDFDNSLELQDATIRRLTIIGEVIKRSPEQFRQEHDEIAWRKAAGMRDVLIHNYDDVNTDQIWLTITQVIPPFKDQIVRLLEAI